MATDKITIDISSVNKVMTSLKGFPKEMTGAASSALNRTVDYTCTQIGRIVSNDYAIKASDIKKTLTKHKASNSNPNAFIESKGETLSFAHFKYSPKKPVRKVKHSVFERAVTVTIKKSKGPVLSRLGFVASTGAQSEDKVQYNVFKRLGKGRLPIAPIRTLSIPQMITSEDAGNKIQTMALQKLDERIQHEIEYRLDKLGKK